MFHLSICVNKPANSDDITLGLRPRVISYLVAGLYNAYRPLKHDIYNTYTVIITNTSTRY